MRRKLVLGLLSIVVITITGLYFINISHAHVND